MITKEEYLKAKSIVDQYEEQEYTDGTNEAMYCSECQALNEQDCICNYIDSLNDSYYEN